MEEYEIVEDAEDGNDITVSFKLKEYATYSTKELTVKANSSTQNTASVTQNRATTKSTTTANNKSYTVKSGDTLWESQKVL